MWKLWIFEVLIKLLRWEYISIYANRILFSRPVLQEKYFAFEEGIMYKTISRKGNFKPSQINLEKAFKNIWLDLMSLLTLSLNIIQIDLLNF